MQQKYYLFWSVTKLGEVLLYHYQTSYYKDNLVKINNVILIYKNFLLQTM